jgi:hypothetical protein
MPGTCHPLENTELDVGLGIRYGLETGNYTPLLTFGTFLR